MVVVHFQALQLRNGAQGVQRGQLVLRQVQPAERARERHQVAHVAQAIRSERDRVQPGAPLRQLPETTKALEAQIKRAEIRDFCLTCSDAVAAKVAKRCSSRAL